MTETPLHDNIKSYMEPLIKSSERQGMRLYVRSCLRPLHTLHMDWRFSMLWFGSSPNGGVMWSIVQSSPSRALLQLLQIGSRIVLA